MPQTSPQSVPHVGPANSSIYSMPGKDEEHPCGELIPSRLICRGSKVWYHAGLEYQVHNCGYFRWLAPELVAAAERRVQDGPAGGAPPFPPQDYPHDPWANSPPLAHSGTMALDPALAALSTAPQSTQLRRSSSASSFPPPTQLTQSGKPKCAVGPCQRIAGSQHCTHRMCKQCCEQQQKGCAYTGHRKNQVIISMSSSFSTAESGDPSTLSRPTPMHSYKYPAASMESCSRINLEASMAPLTNGKGNRCPLCGNQLAVKTAKGGDMPGYEYIRVSKGRKSCNIIRPAQPPHGLPQPPPSTSATSLPTGCPGNTDKGCGRSRIDPGCSRGRCRGHCNELGYCSLWAHERHRQKKTQLTIEPSIAPAGPSSSTTLAFGGLTPFKSFDEIRQQAAAPMLALEQYRQRERDHGNDAAQLQYLDSLYGVKSPTPEAESVQACEFLATTLSWTKLCASRHPPNRARTGSPVFSSKISSVNVAAQDIGQDDAYEIIFE
ncbi:hypothetical protein B0H13DRAFT_1913776 [Mycena leptocephala]|nr:hypothetical protein B0H13DRAFT_1913776 [Mycena leptocephala]